MRVSMAAYEYKDPCLRGFRRVKLSKADHNRIFTKRPTAWHSRYEYYLSDNALLMQRFTGRIAVVISIVLFPLSLIICGLENFKEVWRDHKHLLNQRKYGSFSSDEVWARSDCFPEILKAVTDV